MALHYLRKINHIRKVGESRNCSHLESSSKTIQERVVRTSVLVPLICFQEAPHGVTEEIRLLSVVLSEQC